MGGAQAKLSINKLKDIPETLLFPLKARYLETKKKGGIINDPKSVEILDALDYDAYKTKQINISHIGACLRTIILDEQVKRFLQEHPDGVVVNIGCGLDTRFPRVDNGRVCWFDLDLPAVIELRQYFFQETDRFKFISTSVLDASWVSLIPKGKSTLFIAEGLSFYFSEDENRQMLGIIRDHFSEAECLMEILHPWFIKMSANRNYQDPVSTKAATLLKWGVKSGRELETWFDGLEFIEEWFVVKRALYRFPLSIRIMFTLIPVMARMNKIVHLRFV
jgi:O-methyltransferase involved in polyketide biosynthesis